MLFATLLRCFGRSWESDMTRDKQNQTSEQVVGGEGSSPGQEHPAVEDSGVTECAECGKPFVFGSEERRFYRERGFKEPTRCLDCRERRRAERNADLIRDHDANASHSHYSDAPGHYGGSNGGQRPEVIRRASYPAVCGACGVETTVPFIPRHGRPVYCPACYRERRNR